MSSRFLAPMMIMFLVLATACDTTKNAMGNARAKKAVDPYVGTWNYVVKDTPNGIVEGELIISKASEAYSAIINGEAGEVPLQDFLIEGNNLKGTFDYQGYEVQVKAMFEGDQLKGNMGVDYMTFPMEATKMMAEGK